MAQRLDTVLLELKSKIMNLAKIVAAICFSAITMTTYAHGPNHQKNKHKSCCESKHHCKKGKHHKHENKHSHKQHKHDHCGETEQRYEDRQDSRFEVSYKGPQGDVNVRVRK